MQNKAIVVFDMGKTLAKLSLWRHDGTLIQRHTRNNSQIQSADYLALDIEGITDWLAKTLAKFAAMSEFSIEAFIPVAHGAAAAIIQDGELACAPLDYEQAIPDSVREEYTHLRDRFETTGSPLLPYGLNIGLQLFWLERLYPHIKAENTSIVPLAQYWSWLLCGVTAAEVTSLGCHSDLWQPLENKPSQLAENMKWAAKIPPIRKAGDLLGSLTTEWQKKTGLSSKIKIYCGLHDSNAALYGSRGFSEFYQQDYTVLSTGTWFVAMRSLQGKLSRLPTHLNEQRDCLVNIDVEGKPVPSARFMGGRELEIITENTEREFNFHYSNAEHLGPLEQLIEKMVMVSPTFSPGSGPFPNTVGKWHNKPNEIEHHHMVAHLYLAMVTNELLSLIGTKNKLLIEGRFSSSEIFTRSIATLRPDLKILTTPLDSDVSLGALRLIEKDFLPSGKFVQTKPLTINLDAYREKWLQTISD